jgi:hypothetical protein
MSEKSSAPAFLVTARARPVSPIKPPHASKPIGRRRPGGLHFPEAGQEVQRRGANLRETAAVAAQWNGH